MQRMALSKARQNREIDFTTAKKNGTVPQGVEWALGE
jgi:hypothetical protein